MKNPDNGSKELIITLPNPRLRLSSHKILKIDDEAMHMIRLMEQATLDWEASRKHEVGVALAAIQIDLLHRIVVIREDFDNPANHNFTTLINPEIIQLSGDIVYEREGCLSVRDIYGKVPRYSKVKVRAMDIAGKTITFSAKGFMARVLQHEIDHTNGKLFVDIIKDNPDALTKMDKNGRLIKLTDTEYNEYASVLW